VLLDEIEKAHPDVFNILLQVLDDGRLTDNKGRVVDFKNTIVVMTSNIGSHLIQQRINGNDEYTPEVVESTKNAVFDLLKQTIRPEFLNRIDEVIMFTPLSKAEISQIVLLQFNSLKKRLVGMDINISITPAAIDWIAQAGFDPLFGARPIKRALQRYLINDLSKSLLADEISKEDEIVVDVENDKLVFRNGGS
jgi:ATP-dependent Clp protease ATP-binding subunit ClpB